MTWGAVGSTAVSVIGGALMGGSKEGQRDAKDAATRAQVERNAARQAAESKLSPYTESGEEANRLLSEYLGTAIPAGYAPKPKLQTFIDQGRSEHWRRTGKDFQRNTNVQAYAVMAQKEYEQALKNWETGLKQYQDANPESRGDGRLLKDFTNADFVRDPGYEARLAEGEKGANRTFAARGGLASGSALKALERYRQDYASNEFGQAYNRDAANKGRIYSFLSGEKQTGLNAAGMGIGVSSNTANNNANTMLNTAGQVNQMQQEREDNQSNLFQSALGNLVYGLERNKPVVGRTPDFNPSANAKPWYYSG